MNKHIKQYMEKYKNKKTKETVIIISSQATGMGQNVGTTFVIYEYEKHPLLHPFVMTSKDFHNTYIEIID